MNTFFTYELLHWVDINKLNWENLSRNPNAIHILEKNLDKVDWFWLSGNSNAISIIENNLNKVHWDWLSKIPNAIHILAKNLDKVNWTSLSENPNAIQILEQNLENINWYSLSVNPNIFKPVYDYNAIKLHFHELHKELATLFYHPLRMNLEYTLFCSDDLEYDLQFDKPVISILKKQ